MLLHLFSREIRSGLTQPLFYIFFFLFALLTGAAVVSDTVQIGGAVGNVHRNAPHIVTIYTTIIGVFGLLVATAYYNNAALRDYRFDFNEIMFTTPISRMAYFFGRFLGAWVLACLTLLGVYLGFIVGGWLGPAVGWIEPDQVGPIPWKSFFQNIYIFIIPNMFLAGSIIFGLASKFRSTMVSFVGALLIIIAYIISNNLLSDIDNERLGGLLDIFGISTYGVQSRYYTPVEKNLLAPVLSDLLLYNRLLWMGVGVLITGLFYGMFSFRKRSIRLRRKKADTSTSESVDIRTEKPEKFYPVSNWTLFRSAFTLNFYSIAKSPLFRILFAFSAILVISSLWGGFEYFGLKSYPVTYKVMNVISGQSSIFLLILVVFFSGELVWRDRDVHIDEVVGATPYSILTSLFAKAFSLVVLIFLLYTSMIFVGIIYQLINGFTNIELQLYFIDFFLGQLPIYLTWSFILIAIQVIVNNKYIGYFISVLLLFVIDLLLSIFDIQTNMLDIGRTPFLVYSDMNGFGPALEGAMWFSLYWFLFGLIALIKAAAFWIRGGQSGFIKRTGNATKKLLSEYRLWIFTSFGLWLAVGAFVYYNTQVLNTYKTSDEWEELRANYEKEYKQYEGIPQLTITDVEYEIEIFPKSRDVEAVSKIKLKNKTASEISVMHLQKGNTWEMEFDIPGASIELEDKDKGYLIYNIPAVSPGESMDMVVHTSYISEGFENSVQNTSVVKNGTFFNSGSILPTFGYNPDFELSDKFTRRKYDLEPKDRLPKLEHPCGSLCNLNYLTTGSADWVNVQTKISTSADQIAVAPGSLVKSWSENGRNYYIYNVDHRSQNFYSFISADFEVARRKWQDVDIEVYYDKKHAYNIDMMLDAVERSLEYYTEHFGPYFHKQARIIEFPRYSTFAQAFPGTMPYSESFGFIINLEDEDKNNVIDAVIAHEMAHQWWAHQEISARMQGGTMLVESLAEYSSLMVMKKQLQDDMKMKEFLKYDYNRYLRGRSRETQKELPLLKVENQSYIHYGKGSVVLYAIQDYIGEEQMNAALRDFLEKFRYADPPYPTSIDLVNHIKSYTPDSLQYIIENWIENITLYDFRLTDAITRKADNGKYEASIDVYAQKFDADSVGRETKVPIADHVDIGFYRDEDGEDLFYHERVFMDKDSLQFRVILDEKPVRAAIDPRRMLIERVISDNEKGVTEE